MATLNHPVIFLGTGRCGTTLISEIVMRHPHLAYPSNYQVWFPHFPEINLIRYLFDNKYWNFLGQKAQLNRVGFLNRFSFYPVENYDWWRLILNDSVNMSRDFLLKDEIPPEKKESLHKYFLDLIKYQGKERLGLKITGPSRIRFLKSIFPDALFVNIERDDFAVIQSFLNVPFWQKRGKKKLWWHGAYTENEIHQINENRNNSKYLTAFQIKKLKQITRYELSAYQPEFLNIQYENFINDPEKEISRILKFAGLEKSSENCYKYLEKLKIVDRNKGKEKYFSEKEIEMIEKITLDNYKY